MSDLPIPASFAIAGGTAALVLSFVVLLVAWREPRLDVPSGRRPVPELLARFADSRGLAVGLRVAGLVVLAFTGMGGDGRAGPADQPDVRHRLRLAVGGSGAGVAGVREVLPGRQPRADAAPAPRPGPAYPARPGRLPPTRSGSGTGRPR